MIITAVEPQKGDPNRRNIFADGKFVLGVSREVWDEAGLSLGGELGDEMISRLLRAENLRAAKRKALSLLDYADKSKQAMTERLMHAGFDEETARAAVGELSEEGVISDEAYAEKYAYYLYTKKLCGRRRVVMELIKKGVDRDTAQAAADRAAPEDMAALALALSKKKLKTVRSEKDMDYDKFFAYLLRSGHEYGDIREALAEIFNNN
ncbi:MAG: RecX family transcriptional regulator [Clostridia bacterium]|nr:RecX family transcriptional regulator [Clostridia bacterium]